jgi:diguanylate cyclase (GGDEF)-like protein
LRETDFAARLGGDEFVVLVEDVDVPEIPELIASKLIAAMRHGIAIGNTQIHVTTSIGIAFCRRIIVSQDELLQIADATLYEAKAAGRNTCRTAVVEADPSAL